MKKVDVFNMLVVVLIVLALWAGGVITADAGSSTSRYVRNSGPGVGRIVTRNCITEDDWANIRRTYEGDGIEGSVGDRVIITCLPH